MKYHSKPERQERSARAHYVRKRAYKIAYIPYAFEMSDDDSDGITGECEMCGKYGGEPREGGHFMCSDCWQVWNS